MKKEVISLRIDEKVKAIIDKKAQELNVSRTELIVNAIMNQEACYTDKLKNTVQALINLNNIIIEKERENKEFYDIKDINKIKEGAAQIWRMLR